MWIPEANFEQNEKEGFNNLQNVRVFNIRYVCVIYIFCTGGGASRA